MGWCTALPWVLLAGSAQAENTALRIFPEPQLTPGSIDPSRTPSYLCAHPTSDRRRVPTSLREKVFAAYNVPISTASSYERAIPKRAQSTNLNLKMS